MKKNRSIKTKRLNLDNAFPYLLLLPSIILIIFIAVYPLISGFLYSLSNSTLFKNGELIGFKNYVSLLKLPEFWSALEFSLVFSFFSVIGSYLIGLGLALLLNMKVPGRGFFRAALLIPWIIPSIVSVVCWRWMIGDQKSIVNVMLGLVGIKPILFLADKNWAIFSVCIVKIWRSFPFMMISCLAALQSISTDLYEAVKIDGANRWQTFKYITLPHLKPISIICCILMTIWSFNDFDTIWLMTGGGPADATKNLIVLAFQYAFIKNSIGIGSAIAIATLIILTIFSEILLKRQNQED